MPKSPAPTPPISDCESCVKCGTCTAVCPVYSAVPEESNSPRGKMALMEAVEQGHLTPSVRYKAYLEMCLLCGACQEACPNAVRTFPLMLLGRADAAERVGIRPAKGFILRRMVGAARLLRLALKTGSFFSPLIFKRVPKDSGLRRRFPLPLISKDRTVPQVAPEFFTEIFDGLVSEGQGPRVGIFAGCMTNYFYPEVGQSMVNLLRTLGTTVIVPKDQTCCGMPALSGGAHATARDLAVRNLEAFERHELDFIVTGCASCGGNLKDYFPHLLSEAGVEKRRIEAFSSRVADINEFLAGSGLLPHLRREGAAETRKPLRVTYHHPCHLGRLQGVREDPIRLIKSMPGAEYVPMAEADRCCGMGGSFSLEHYEVSKAINDRKIEKVLASGADAVVTSCPACILHIRDGLRRHGREDIEVMHITELLTRKLRKASMLREEPLTQEPKAQHPTLVGRNVASS